MRCANKPSSNWLLDTDWKRTILPLLSSEISMWKICLYDQSRIVFITSEQYFFNPINQINRVCVTPSKLLSCWVQAVAHVCNTSLPGSQTREWKRVETSTPWNSPCAMNLLFGNTIVRHYIASWCNLKWEDINTYAVYYRVGGGWVGGGGLYSIPVFLRIHFSVTTERPAGQWIVPPAPVETCRRVAMSLEG